MINKLNAKQVKDRTEPGRLGDGGGLWLRVSKSGSKLWLFVYRYADKRPEISLGPYPAVSLADARRKAEEARRYLAEKPKRDPKAVWEQARAESQAVTFGSYSQTLMGRILSEFRNAKHRQQWQNTLRSYCKPVWGMPMQSIETVHVLKCLQPIWTTKPETARRVRGRMERIFDAAKAEGLRTGENPARWRGNLEASLPKKRPARKHFRAVPYSDLPALFADLEGNNAGAAQVLRFLILTGARSGEARGALWSEIDTESCTWTLPPERMKAERQHVVPLSDPAMSIIENAGLLRRCIHVFPGHKRGKPFSETALRKQLRSAYPHQVDGRFVTLHGFRSSFRDWAGDKTSFSREVAELSIAHAAGNALERAYRRGDALEKRRALMEAWGQYCTGTAGTVVQLHA